MLQPLDILKQYWGFDSFRPMQLDIIESVLEGRDTLALLPTGGGKSICFQVPALCQEGVCIVVSPLIALMKDQVQNLKSRQISAEAIYSGMSIKDIDRIFDNAVHGNLKFLYLSPERLTTELAQARIKRMKISLFAIDEAHCISQWGYDFRPSYLNIAEVRELQPEVPVMALTATATATVVDDMQEKLAFGPDSQVFKKSFARQNLAYVVLQEQDKLMKLLDILKKIKGTAIVYVLNRKATKDIAQYLQKNNISADYYHAGRHADVRSAIQDRWINNEIRVIVATNAFGMGIDKPDVRVVAHITLPDSLEAYFQEAGRAGRDGQKAYAVLLYNSSDRDRLERNYEGAFPPFKEIRRIYKALGSYFQLAIGAGQFKSFDFDIVDFARRYDIHPIKILNTLKILMRAEYLELSDAVFFPSTIQVMMDKKGLYDYQLRQPRLEKIIKVLLRSYQGIFNHPVSIKEQRLADFLKMPYSHVIAMLKKMHQEKVIRYQAQRDVPTITYLVERLDANDVTFDQEQYNFLKDRYKKRMEAALHYTEALQCRSQLLLAYFDEKDPPTCGQCDVCLGRHEEIPKAEELKTITTKIQQLVQQQPLPLDKLVSHFPAHLENKVLYTIEHLQDNAFLQRDAAQLFSWSE